MEDRLPSCNSWNPLGVHYKSPGSRTFDGPLFSDTPVFAFCVSVAETHTQHFASFHVGPFKKTCACFLFRRARGHVTLRQEVVTCPLQPLKPIKRFKRFGTRRDQEDGIRFFPLGATRPESLWLPPRVSV